MANLKKDKLERYVDRRSSVQIANGCLDFMICGAVASIQLDIVADNLVAITVLCAVLTLFVTVYCLVVIRKTCREDWFEKALFYLVRIQEVRLLDLHY